MKTCDTTPMTKTLLIWMGFFALLGYLALLPYVVIWSLNTLFQTQIPYTWHTYLATLVLWGLVQYRPTARSTTGETR